MLELPVDPSISPYLISSTKSLMWRDKAFPNNVVRVAIRKDDVENLYSEVVQAIYETGVDNSWENSYPLSKSGLGKAVSYLKYYGISDVEVLSSEDDLLELGSSFNGVTVSKVSWLNKSYVVVPKDRSYLGSITDFGDNKYAILIHNPSRGISFSL
tara:strand:- start:451 stop:918 length:468 start_codon:yes stop_codon:yes gene_type:complete